MVLPRLTTVLLWLMVVVELLYLGGLLVSGGANNPLVNIWLSLATQWVPVTIFWLVAARTRFARLEVILAAAGVTLSAIGDTYYLIAMDADGYLAFPSPADVGYLLFYPLMVAALVVLVRRQIAGAAGLVLLESAVACLGAAAVLAVILDPVLSEALASGNVIESAIAIAFPLFDLVLLAALAGIVASPNVQVGPRWWALAVGLAIFVWADVVYAFMGTQGAYLAGTPLDASWAIGFGFIAWWVAGTGIPATAPVGRVRRPIPVPIPAIAVVAGVGVLIFDHFVRQSILAVVLAGLTVAMAAVPIIFHQVVLGRLIRAQDEVVRRLTDLDRSKDDMMVTMNHEFRTPLTAINGYVELLLDGDGGKVPDPAVGMLRVIESNAARLQDLIDDLLTVSKLDSGGGVLDLAPRYLAPLLNRAADSVRSVTKARGIPIRVHSDDFSLVVDADPARLERAFEDLIENAVKFSTAGGEVNVYAERATASPTESIVIVRVVDTGIGIPKDDLPNLSTKFFRASNVQGAAIPGEGLGLAIAKGIIDAHDGLFTVESTLGAGTTVTVELPLSPLGVPLPRRESER
jgi:signal transduction histidine kinase